MSSDLGPIETTLLVTKSLEKIGVSYYLVGSIASAFHGVSRSTLDSDIVAALSEEHVQGLVSNLEGEFFIDKESIRKAMANQGNFNVIHRNTMFKVDIFLPQDEFDRMRFKRSHSQQVIALGDRALIAGAEDTILAKLKWFRMGDETSDRQWQDVLGILKVQGKALDQSLLKEWSRKLNIEDLLQKALEQSEIK